MFCASTNEPKAEEAILLHVRINVKQTAVYASVNGDIVTQRKLQRSLKMILLCNMLTFGNVVLDFCCFSDFTYYIGVNSCINCSFHRLRGSASPVLMATA